MYIPLLTYKPIVYTLYIYVVNRFVKLCKFQVTTGMSMYIFRFTFYHFSKKEARCRTKCKKIFFECSAHIKVSLRTLLKNIL